MQYKYCFLYFNQLILTKDIYRILLVSEQIKNFLTAHKHFYFLIPKRRNKRMDEQSDSAASQSEDKS